MLRIISASADSLHPAHMRAPAVLYGYCGCNPAACACRAVAEPSPTLLFQGRGRSRFQKASSTETGAPCSFTMSKSRGLVARSRHGRPPRAFKKRFWGKRETLFARLGKGGGTGGLHWLWMRSKTRCAGFNTKRCTALHGLTCWIFGPRSTVTIRHAGLAFHPMCDLGRFALCVSCLHRPIA